MKTTTTKDTPLTATEFQTHIKLVLNAEFDSSDINTHDYALGRNRFKQAQLLKAIRFAEKNLHLKLAREHKDRWTRQIERLKVAELRWKSWKEPEKNDSSTVPA